MMNEVKIPVAVVGPESLVSAGITCLLNDSGEFEIIASGDDTEHAAAVLRARENAIVLFYASAPGTRAAELDDLIGQLRAMDPEPAFLAVIEPEDVAAVRACVEAEVNAAIATTSGPEELMAALRACHQGSPYFAAEIRGLAASEPMYAALTRREREILGEIASGYTSRVIAEHLGIAYKTVETHRQNIARKLDARGVADLVKHAIRAGLTSLQN